MQKTHDTQTVHLHELWPFFSWKQQYHLSCYYINWIYWQIFHFILPSWDHVRESKYCLGSIAECYTCVTFKVGWIKTDELTGCAEVRGKERGYECGGGRSGAGIRERVITSSWWWWSYCSSKRSYRFNIHDITLQKTAVFTFCFLQAAGQSKASFCLGSVTKQCTCLLCYVSWWRKQNNRPPQRWRDWDGG